MCPYLRNTTDFVWNCNIYLHLQTKMLYQIRDILIFVIIIYNTRVLV
jgi:hypothetical protein